MRFYAALTLAACLAPAAAIFEDDAYHIDFHYALLGRPKHEATFFQKPYAGSKASLLYSISHSQTIGAINPKDGALVWRQHFSAEPHVQGHLRSGSEQDTVISAVGDRIAAWSASDGRLVWETTTPGAVVEDLEILEQEDGMTVNEAKDAIVLLSGTSQGVKRLDGKTGQTKWTFEDTSGDAPFQVSTSPTTVYYLSIHSPMLGGSKLKVTYLSPITGKKIDQVTLSSDAEITARSHILFAGANTAAPLLAWTDKANKVLKVNIIGTKNVASFNTPADVIVENIVLHAPNHVNSRSHFLVEYQTAVGHYAEVYHVDLKKTTISKSYSLPELRSKGTFTTSTSDANVYFTRITEDDVTVYSSESYGVLGRWSLKHSLATAGAYPVHGASEVVVKSGTASAVRSAVYYSNGQWVLHRNDELAWSRPEFLSGSVSAVWAGLPEEEALAQALEEESHRNLASAYVHRLQKHIQDLQYLPAWLQSIPTRLLGSVFGKSKGAAIDDIKLDTFGFHKLVVVATEDGRLAALDVGSRGKVLWNVDLHQFAPDANLNSPSLKAHRGYVEVKDPSLTGSIYINYTTGSRASVANVKEQVLALSEPQKLVSFTLVDGSLKGFLESRSSSEPLWSFSPAPGERIVAYTARPLQDPVASIGKVLGDRSVLYKYLNPNIVLVSAVIDSAHTAAVYLLDSASGQLLHTMSHSDVDTSRPIPSTISEHWFSYSFTTAATAGASSRGYQLIVSDLYESPLPDDRGPLGATSNSSTVQPSSSTGDVIKPYILSQSYQIPAEISHMTVTQTRQGITNRELLVTVPSLNSIIGIPRHDIDPRRPIGRDPNAQEKEEGLAHYTPSIQWDPKWHLTHKYEVIGVKDVISSESGIESTSLIFAYGLDIFGTRVAPSFAFDILGKGFNKISMLITVAALFVGVIFVAPLVRRKQINSLWTIP
ncbi:DUF1620-domain-containing protein [Setomelanomma holmii]|uniref:ER membrane protein complex subunit 1 n=1 Tax=Setomelanomma holmii TaxID=210430 RepID=A0A9P4HBV8_9PLEO|nr:DUF1620-domain-containing protein [Setomelanomma holmii]